MNEKQDPQPVLTRQHNGFVHLLTPKLKPLCRSRLSLSEPVVSIPFDDPRHPDHSLFDAVTAGLCPKCRVALAKPATETAEDPVPVDPREALRSAVSFAYDLQKLRIQQGNRSGPQAPGAEALLTPPQQEFMRYACDTLELLEQDAFKAVDKLCRHWSIYPWLRAQKGCGPTMAGVLIAYIDPHRAPTASSVWAWCGLSVVDGHAQRRQKGQKANFNPWLKSKVLAVLGGSLLKANSPWRKFYDDYKHRLQSQRLPVCGACGNKGLVAVEPEAGSSAVPAKQACHNCNGGAGPIPWGNSDGHRHNAAMRYMVKMFLAEFWKQWRTLEGLPVREPYAEQYLGLKHHTREEV